MVHSQGFRWFLPVQVQTSCGRDEFCLKEGFCSEFPRPKKKLRCSSATANLPHFASPLNGRRFGLLWAASPRTQVAKPKLKESSAGAGVSCSGSWVSGDQSFFHQHHGVGRGKGWLACSALSWAWFGGTILNTALKLPGFNLWHQIKAQG